jgi:hypothetical protein
MKNRIWLTEDGEIGKDSGFFLSGGSLEDKGMKS